MIYKQEDLDDLAKRLSDISYGGLAIDIHWWGMSSVRRCAKKYDMIVYEAMTCRYSDIPLHINTDIDYIGEILK